MANATWKETTSYIETRQVTGTLDLSTTLSGTAVVDNGDGTVTVTTNDTHGFLAGSHLYIEGSTNYDGVREVTAVATSTITFKGKYTAETPGGTETVKFAVDPKCDWQLLEINLHLSAAAATSESLVATLDATAGSAYDQVIFSENVNGKADIVQTFDRYFEYGDKLRFAMTNTDGRTYALNCKYRRVR